MITLAYLVKTNASGHPATWVRNEKLVPLFENPNNAQDVDRIINALGPGYADLTPGNYPAVIGELRFNDTIVDNELTSYLNYCKIGYDASNVGTSVNVFPRLSLTELYGSNATWLGPLTANGGFRITTKNYNLKDLMGKEVTVAKLVTRTKPLKQADQQKIGFWYDTNGYTYLYAKPSNSQSGVIDFTTGTTTSLSAPITVGEDNVSIEFYPSNYYDASVLVPKIVNDVSSNFVAR